jgi:hypothetical protein
LRANDINPNDIPHDAHVSLVDNQLTTDVWARNEQGKLHLDPGLLGPARTTTTFPISTPPPDDVAKWLRPRCPTCGR